MDNKMSHETGWETDLRVFKVEKLPDQVEVIVNLGLVLWPFALKGKIGLKISLKQGGENRKEKKIQGKRRRL
jgi:hypothetical protein